MAKYIEIIGSRQGVKEMYRDHFGEFVCGYWGLKG